MPVSGFTVRYTGGLYELESGEMTLQMRVYRAVESHPGIGTTRLRDVVGGKAREVDAAVRDLLKTYAIEDRGSAQAHAYYVRPVLAGTGPGQGRDRAGTARPTNR